MGHDMTTRMGATMPTWAIEGEETAILSPEEWPKRDAVPFVPADAFNILADHLIRDGVVGVRDGKLITADEMYIGLPVQLLEVTDEMRRIGGDTLRQCREQEVFHEQAAEAAFRLMYAQQRVPLVSDAEIALTKERDEARAELAQARSDIEGFRSVRDTYLDKMDRDAATIGALRAELAKFTAQNVETEAPDPVANAIREHETDRRMVGR